MGRTVLTPEDVRQLEVKEEQEESILAMLGIVGTFLNLFVIVFVYIYTTLWPELQLLLQLLLILLHHAITNYCFYKHVYFPIIQQPLPGMIKDFYKKTGQYNSELHK